MHFSLIVTACVASPMPTRSLAPLSASASHSSRAIRAGTSGNYPPLSDWNGDRPDGFAPALLANFAQAQHTNVAWTRFSWPSLTADMRADVFDLAADGVTVRADRSIAGRFTVPIARGGAVLLVHQSAYGSAQLAGPTPHDLLDAIRRPTLRIVVNAGGYLEGVTRRLLSGSEIRAIPDNAAVREAFVRGDADAAMTNTFEAPRWKAGLSDVETVGPLTSDVTALWVRADRGDLAETLDAWLLEEEASGRLERLRAKWLGDDSGGPTARPVDALVAATAERLALMPLVAAAKKRSGEGVEQVAQEARVLAAAQMTVARAAVTRGSPRRTANSSTPSSVPRSTRRSSCKSMRLRSLPRPHRRSMRISVRRLPGSPHAWPSSSFASRVGYRVRKS